VDVELDKVTNRLATPSCPDTYTIAFVAGTEPRDTCDQTGGVRGFFSRIFGGNSEKPLPPPGSGGNPQAAGGVQSETDAAKKKKGLLGRIAGVFKGDSDSHNKNAPPPSKPEAENSPPQR
jgi:hypothetical protein